MNPPTPSAAGASAREQALDWFVRRKDAAFTAADEAAFQAWCNAGETHRRAFEDWQAQWSAFDAVPKQVRTGLLQRFAGSAARQAIGPRPAPPRRRFVPALVAACMVAATGVAALLAWHQVDERPRFAQSFSTARGQQAEVPLPDGSRLRLDASTRLQVAFHQGRREANLLEGQAVFSVQPDVARPFTVQAGPARVTVVGTRFSVRYTPQVAGSEGVRVAVEEGRVQVQGGTQVRELGAGQQLLGDASGQLGEVSRVSGQGIAPWREHRVAFQDVRLDHALAELGRYQDVRLAVRDPSVAALRVTGVFDPRDMATFARVLPLSLPVRLREVDGTTEIVAAR